MRYVMLSTDYQALPYWPGVHVFWTHVTFFVSNLTPFRGHEEILTSSFLQSFNPSLGVSSLKNGVIHPYLISSGALFWIIMWSVPWFQMKSPESYDSSVCGAPNFSRLETCWLRMWHDQMIPWWSHFLTQQCFAFITRYNFKLQTINEPLPVQVILSLKLRSLPTLWLPIQRCKFYKISATFFRALCCYWRAHINWYASTYKECVKYLFMVSGIFSAVFYRTFASLPDIRQTQKDKT